MARQLNDIVSKLPKNVEEAVMIALMYGVNDGAHHKMWVIDQMLRELVGSDYDELIQIINADDSSGVIYIWDEGIAP